MTPERLRWGLGGLTLLISAVVVSTAFTTIPHTGGDNAGYISLAHGLLVDGSYLDVFDPERMKHTKYPPVFPGLLAMMIALGARTWGTLKLAAAVPTVLAVVATYVWAERRVGVWAAFGVAVLLTFSSGIVYYSHWVLSDPLFLALTILALQGTPRPVWALAAGAAGCLIWTVAAHGAGRVAQNGGTPSVPFALGLHLAEALLAGALVGWLASRASVLTTVELELNIPPGEKTLVQFDCEVPFDTSMQLVGGHLHEEGSKFQVLVGPDVDNLAPIYTVDPWLSEFRDAPPIELYMDDPVPLPAGSIVRTIFITSSCVSGSKKR